MRVYKLGRIFLYIFMISFSLVLKLHQLYTKLTPLINYLMNFKLQKIKPQSRYSFILRHTGFIAILVFIYASWKLLSKLDSKKSIPQAATEKQENAPKSTPTETRLSKKLNNTEIDNMKSLEKEQLKSKEELASIPSITAEKSIAFERVESAHGQQQISRIDETPVISRAAGQRAESTRPLDRTMSIKERIALFRSLNNTSESVEIKKRSNSIKVKPASKSRDIHLDYTQSSSTMILDSIPESIIETSKTRKPGLTGTKDTEDKRHRIPRTHDTTIDLDETTLQDSMVKESTQKPILNTIYKFSLEKSIPVEMLNVESNASAKMRQPHNFRSLDSLRTLKQSDSTLDIGNHKILEENTYYERCSDSSDDESDVRTELSSQASSIGLRIASAAESDSIASPGYNRPPKLTMQETELIGSLNVDFGSFTLPRLSTVNRRPVAGQPVLPELPEYTNTPRASILANSNRDSAISVSPKVDQQVQNLISPVELAKPFEISVVKSGRGLTEFPVAEIRRNTVANLTLDNNALKSFPFSLIDSLTGLKVLNLSYNMIENLPTGIGKLESLEYLYLKQNKIIEVK